MNIRVRQPGLTLVELVIALTVTTLVAGSTLAIIRSATGAQQRVDAHMDLQQEAHAALAAVAVAFGNASRSDDAYLEGVDDWNGDLPADRVRFFALSRRPVRPGQAESELRDCEFLLLPEPAGLALVRRLDPTRNDLPDLGGVLTRIAGHVAALDLEYLDGQQWQRDWPVTNKGWPGAVRIRLAVASNARPVQIWWASRTVNFPYLPDRQSLPQLIAPEEPPQPGVPGPGPRDSGRTSADGRPKP
jgi:type II secretory pathway pseudopilin PulG